MQIDAIDIYHVALPLRVPQTTPFGAIDALETVLVRVQSGDVAGWGEASPGTAPLAGGDWAGGVFAGLKRWLAPAVAGRFVESGEALQERLKPFHGNRFAKAALDTAWWDLKARREGKPLYQLLDPKRDAIEVGPVFDQMDSIDDLLSAVGRAVDEGYARVKLMFRPGWDVQMVDFVRKEFPVLPIGIDVEGDLTLGHWEMLCRLEDFGLSMIEQPLSADDFVGHAQLQDAVRTLCLDESITTPEQAEIALDLRSCQYVNLEPGRVGGLTPAATIHDACHDACVGCYVGAVPRTALGTRIALALAAKANCTYPADDFRAEEVLARDLGPSLLPVPSESDGVRRVPLWSEPGLGIEPDFEELETFCLEQAHAG